MAKAGHGYPQVMPRAADLMHARVITVPRQWSVARALARARASRALVVADAKRGARVTDLERAAAWGLGRMSWTDAGERAGTVSPMTDEIAVRRLIRDGASMVVVREGGRVVGAIEQPFLLSLFG